MLSTFLNFLAFGSWVRFREGRQWERRQRVLRRSFGNEGFIDCLAWVCGWSLWVLNWWWTWDFFWVGTYAERTNQEADSETMERLQAQHQLRMTCISVAMAVLFGYGAAQSAPISDGGAQPPLGVQLEGLTAHATRLLRQQYGFCITDRLRFAPPLSTAAWFNPCRTQKGFKLAVLSRSYEDRLPFVPVYWIFDLVHCMQRYVLHWCGWYLNDRFSRIPLMELIILKPVH